MTRSDTLAAMVGEPGGGQKLRVGFSCLWERPRTRSWSMIPSGILSGLEQEAEVIDIGLDPPPAARLLLKGLYAHRQSDGWHSDWREAYPLHAIAGAVTPRKADRTGCDIVVQVGELGRTRQPFFLVQDLNFDFALRYLDEHGTPLPGFELYRRRLLQRRSRAQRPYYDQAAGVFVMSQWFADDLIGQGVDPGKVHVFHAGRNAEPADRPGVPPAAGPRSRLLFVGVDFVRKGGDLVSEAVRLLRQRGRNVTLTVAGPETWPLSTPIPDGVTFLGRVPAGRVAQLLAEHDLFVMPSRFEAFGIAFVEALAAGLPCVARNQWAMPEIITPGHNGVLVDAGEGSPLALAAAIERALDDDDLFRRTWQDRQKVAEHYTWRRVAQQIVHTATASV